VEKVGSISFNKGIDSDKVHPWMHAWTLSGFTPLVKDTQPTFVGFIHMYNIKVQCYCSPCFPLCIQSELLPDQLGFFLMQVFGFLHEAWDKIGFTHGDLNCANVMEHRGDADLYLPAGFANDQETQMFKLPGMLMVIPQGHWSCCPCYSCICADLLHACSSTVVVLASESRITHGKTGTHLRNFCSDICFLIQVQAYTDA